jgi:hypothetical protein
MLVDGSTEFPCSHVSSESIILLTATGDISGFLRTDSISDGKGFFVASSKANDSGYVNFVVIN